MDNNIYGIKESLSQAMNALATSLHQRILILSESKMMATISHLNKCLANQLLIICAEDHPLPSQLIVTYLGLKLDQSLTYWPQLEHFKKKITFHRS